MKKIILFDLDGTLTDSSEGIIKCCLYALEKYNIKLSSEELNTFIGPPLRYSFLRYGVPENEVENALSRYRERYLTVGKFENRPYDGIADLLEKLKSAGHTLFVATAKPEVTAREIIEHFGLKNYFVDVCGASFDTSRDSKAAVISHLLNTYELTGEIIMIGDTVFDVEGAAEFGIPTVGVSWGFGKAEDMLSAGAKAVANSMDELFELIN